jgi:hypothetical protein
VSNISFFVTTPSELFERLPHFYLTMIGSWETDVGQRLLGASDMVRVYVRITLIQLATPDEMRGRVSAVNSLFIGASNELGEFESGVSARLGSTARPCASGFDNADAIGAITCGTTVNIPVISEVASSTHTSGADAVPTREGLHRSVLRSDWLKWS